MGRKQSASGIRRRQRRPQRSDRKSGTIVEGGGNRLGRIRRRSPESAAGVAEEGVQRALAFGADFILAVGGGSAIDTAKAVAHGTANPGEKLWDIWTGKAPLTKSLPIGAVLTIPAAGSEMSDSAVLTNEAIGKKAGINTPFNRCRFAVMNPELAATLPAYQIACGVTDIMMHTMERYFIPGIPCEMTDCIAEGLLRTVIHNGPKVLENPSDYDAMAEIMWCGSLSHNNLTECGRGKIFPSISWDMR